MTYIKLLTVLTTLALLTACGGAATPKTDNTGGDTTTDCKTNAFHADCDTHPNVTILRIDTCSGDNDIHSTCGAIITSFCTENPHRTFAGVCTGDDYLPLRIADCIEGGKADGGNCRQIAQNATKNTTLTACLENPFATACESVPDFMSSFALARTNRLTFCDNSDNATNDLCTGDNVGIICGIDQFNASCPDATYGTPRQEACLMDIMTNPKCTGEMGIATLFCKADPFHDSPACKADTYLPDRIADCIADGNADGVNCANITADTAMNTMITDCLENPFATACESVSAFSSSFALARTNRLTFCNDNMNVADALCTDDNLMNVCGFNPFNAICLAGTTYATPRQTACLMDIMEDDSCRGDMGLATVFCKASPFDTSNACMADTYLPLRLDDCIMDGNAGDMKCDTLTSDNAKNTAITACLTNPFADACASNADFMTYADMARTNRESFCESGSGELCTVLTTCQDNPFDPICGTYFESEKIPHCITDSNADETRCANLFTASSANACLANPFTPSCKTDMEFDDYADDARANRVSFCNMNATDNLCKDSVATICGFDVLSMLCTDASYLPDRVTACITDGNAGLAKCNNIFTATPATNNCLANPFTDACTADMAFTSYLMNARTKRDTFCGTNPSDTVCDTLNLCKGNPFATECEAYFQPARTNLCGGATDFATCVNVGDLPTYPTKSNEVTGSGFLTANDTGLNTTDIQLANSSIPRTISIPLTIGRLGLDSNSPNGFAYFATITTSFEYYFAGILPTTNLGAPLAAQPTAVWAGHFSTQRSTNIATNFYVDFSTGRFGFSNAGGDGFGDFTHSSLFGTYTMNAHFGSHASASGYSAGRMGGTISVSDAGTTSSATIVGLIGAEGVRLVFYTTVGETGTLGGGFTATNPD